MNKLNRKFSKKDLKRFQDISVKDGPLILGNHVRLDPHKSRTSLILGTSGSGKTNTHIDKNIIPGEDNYIILDMGGEKWVRTHERFEEAGYDIIRFDTSDIKNSQSFNFLKLCENDERKTIEIADGLHRDLSCGKAGLDPFWGEAESLLLRMIMLYLVFNGHHVPHDIMGEIMQLEKYGFEYLKTGKYREFYEECKEKDFCGTYINTYSAVTMVPGKTFNAVLINLYTKLVMMELNGFCDLTDKTDFDIRKLFINKTVVYIGGSWYIDKTFNVLSKILFAQCLQAIEERSDITRHCRCMADAFIGLGNMNTVLPYFLRYAALKKMSFSFTMQCLEEGYGVYNRDEFNMFVSNMNNIVFMGCWADETLSFIEDKWNRLSKDPITRSDLIEMYIEREVIFIDKEALVDVKTGLKDRRK